MENVIPGGDSSLAQTSARAAINAGRMGSFQISTIVLCALLNVMDGFDIMAMVFAASTISQEWQLSGARLGLLLSAGMVGMALGSVVIAPLADRIGRRRVVIGSLALICIGMFYSAVAGGFDEMAVGRVVTGLGVGGLIPSLSVIVAEFSSDKWRGGAVSFMGVGYTLGAVLGGILANALLATHGWRMVFFSGAAGTVVLLSVVLLRLPESVDFLMSRRPPNALRRINHLLRIMGHAPLVDLPATSESGRTKGRTGVGLLLSGPALPVTLMLWVLSFLVLLSTYFVISWTPRLLVLSGLSEAQSITGGVLLNGGGLLGCLMFGWLATRVSFKWVTLTYFLVGTAAVALFSFMHHNLAIAFPLTLIIGICLFGAIAGVNTLAPTLYDAAARSTGVGLATGIGRIGGILSPALTGFMVDAGQQIGVLYLYYCAPLLAAALVMWWMQRVPSSISSAQS